jgi:peptide/nickel transport system permease protein
MQIEHDSYWMTVWKQYRRHKLGMLSLIVVCIFLFIGIYAPFFASSKPLVVSYAGDLYFPLFSYLFYPGFFTKPIDVFYNLLMFTLPFFLLSLCLKYAWKKWLLASAVLVQVLGFIILYSFGLSDPASSPELSAQKQAKVQERIKRQQKGPDYLRAIIPPTGWDFQLEHMNDYGKLNMLIQYRLQKQQHERLMAFNDSYQPYAMEHWESRAIAKERSNLISTGVSIAQLPSDAQLKQKILAETSPEEIADLTALPTLWSRSLKHEQKRIQRFKEVMQNYPGDYALERKQWETSQTKCSAALGNNRDCTIELQSLMREMRGRIADYADAEAGLKYYTERRQWLETESAKLSWVVMPLVRPLHWEDDAGGKQSLNQYISWNELTRVNRKDLTAALIFGIRVSIMVGILAVSLALAIGVPIGAAVGYYGGKIDIIVSRLMEIWEAMPTFFMLLIVVAMLQSKSIFLVICVIGIFGWTGFSRFLRGEFLKQRKLPYVEACTALGFSDMRIIFSHVLPNAIPPLLTMLPFAIMGAISSEAGLSFLGLGEEGSSSWGVLMDEGRMAFPGESYLLWPPAIMLTVLLIAIALMGDALRDAIDPKLRKN